MNDKKSSPRRWVAAVALVVMMVGILTIPFLLNPKSDFGGSDDHGTDMITDVDPSYHPWFFSLWTPPGSETESLLFALQAALGAGVGGYVLGFIKGRYRDDAGRTGTSGDPEPVGIGLDGAVHAGG